MAVSSKVQICNLALLRLGTNPITSLTEGNTAANACNFVYDHCRESLLRRHLWNFASERVALAAADDAPAFKYTNKFPLPSDFLRVKEIYEQSTEYCIEGPYLLTNDPAPLQLAYIKDIVDVTKFDSLFVEALVLMIIIKIGPRIQGDGFNPAVYAEELNRVLMDAKRVDSQDASPKQFTISTFLNSRFRSAQDLESVGKSWGDF
jgi:hypothetical protein